MLFTLRACAPGTSLTRGNTVMSLTVTAGISVSLVQDSRLIELSTTSNLSAFLAKKILEIQGLGHISRTQIPWTLKTKIRFQRSLYFEKRL
jgi:hypothetical protein